MPADMGDARRPRSWLLIVSLMINLLVLGAVAGAVLVPHHRGHGSHHGERKGPLTRFVETLPAARSAELKKILDPYRASLEASWDEVREARKSVIDAAAREPFERPALDAALARFGEADAKVRDARARKFAETVSAMTPEERQAFRDRPRKRRGSSWWPFGRGERRGHGQEKE